MAQRNPYFPTPPTAAWVRQPWPACLGFVTMMKYVAKTTVFIASNTLIGVRNLRARPSHGRRLPVQHYTACLGGTRSLWSARNFGCTREHARVSVVGGYRAAESGAGGTLGCSGSQTGESTTAAPAPVNAALSHRQRSDPTEQASNSAKERRVRAAHLGGWELHRLRPHKVEKAHAVVLFARVAPRQRVVDLVVPRARLHHVDVRCQALLRCGRCISRACVRTTR